MRKSIALAVAVVTANFFVPTLAQATDAVWAGGSGNWSTENVASAGWVGTKPDGTGDSATYSITGHASATTTQDLTGSRTVGKIELSGGTTENASWIVALNTGKNLIMNQDGAGPGTALISITTTSTAANPAILMTGGGGIITLNDDLLISNTSTATRSGGAIQIDPQFQGTGNLTFYNVSNSITVGQIALQRTGPGGSSFGGNTTIAKGAVTFTRGDRFTPTAGDQVIIGSAGNGDATLAYVGGTTGGALGNMENNFVAAANTTGTNVFATSSATTGLFQVKSSSSQTLPHSLVTLNGDLTFSVGGPGTFQIGDPIVGVGKLTKNGAGSGLFRVTNTNTYSGGTIVDTGSLAVGHADAINNGFGFYDATDGTLGSGNVTVNSTATFLEIETGVATANVIADTATLSLAGTGGNGYALLDSDVNERVGGLVLGGVEQTLPGTYGSSSSGATFRNDQYFSGPGTITLSPDFNNNGVIDPGDYVVWRKSPASNGGIAAFDLWRANFANAAGAGSGLGSGHHAVPEPGTLLLAVAGVLMRCAGRRRR